MSKDSTVDFSALRRRGRLPAPPDDASNNLTAPEHAPPESPAPPAPATPTAGPARGREGEAAAIVPAQAARGRVVQPYTPPEPIPPQMDGRSRLRTGRTEPFSTRVRPDFRSRLIFLANQRQCTMAEALELAVEALERELGVRPK
jgi:hypothetical protein